LALAGFVPKGVTAAGGRFAVLQNPAMHIPAMAIERTVLVAFVLPRSADELYTLINCVFTHGLF
jgi:hypothetical protein